MELHQLRYFVAAAEAGSISRASQRCETAQPTVSQQIQKLEKSVGMPLFDRVGRGIALNDAGRALLPRAKRILAEVQDAGRLLRDDLDAGCGGFHLGAIATIAPYLLPGALSQFTRRFDRCELQITEDLSERLVEGLVDNTLDAAIMSTPVEHELVEYQTLATEKMMAVAPANSPLAKKRYVNLTDLREEPVVLISRMHCLGRQVNEFCATRGVGSRIVCRSSQLMTVLELVRMGLGVSVVPEMAAATSSQSGYRFLPIRTHAPSRVITLAWRTNRGYSPLLRALAEILKDQLATLRYTQTRK